MKKRLLFVLISTLIIVPWALFIFLLHVTTELDFSTQPLAQPISPPRDTSLYLVTYADGAEVFFKNRNMLNFSATNRGIDFIYNYERHHLDCEFLQKNPILIEKLGAGYWLWKPYLILKTLQHVPEGSLIVYADSGLFFRQPIRDMIESGLKEKDILLFTYDPKIDGSPGQIASADTFAAMGCTDHRCRYGHHPWAGLIAVRNSARSRAFIGSWLKFCENQDLLKGNSNRLPNFPEFTHHQHDEAILSVLSNKESAMVNFVVMDHNFRHTIFVHRRKNEEISLLDDYLSNFSRFQQKFFKSKLIRKIQSLVNFQDAPHKN